MNSLCFYNGKVYNIIYNFKYNDNEFSICSDNKKLVYFKRHKVNDKYQYIPYKRWIKAFELSDLISEANSLEKLISGLNSRKKYDVDDIRKCVDKFINPHKKVLIKKKFFNKYFVIFLVCFIFLTLGGVNLFNWYHEGREIKSLMNDILDNTKIEESIAFTSSEIPEVTGEAHDNQKYGENYWKYMQTTMISVDFDNLLKVNPDTRGWIYINNTNVNYPFVQGSDNSYYLNHSFDKTYNVAGWLFADYKSSFKEFGNNTVIYGHGRVDQVMFGSLQNVLNDSWYTNKDNQIIKLSTPEKNTLWQIFSIYTIPSELYYLTHTFENDESYQKFLDTMLSRSIYNFGVNVSTKDKVLTISTCLDNNGNRIVIQSKLIKEQSR